MVVVHIRPFFDLKNIIGNPSLEMRLEKGATVKGLLDNLMEVYHPALQKALIDPNTNDIYSHYQILVRGRNIRLLDDGLFTELRDGDVISLLQTVAGG